jgi:hypothetical protein
VKKLMALAIGFVFLASFLGVAGAQTGTTTAPADKKTEKMEKTADKAEKKMDKKPAAKNASGTVKSASADSLVVAGKEKGKETEWTFAVDAKTKVKKGGKDATAADIKAGDTVQVKYTEEAGKATAQSVNAKEAKAAKAADKKAANPCAPKTEKK